MSDTFDRDGEIDLRGIAERLSIETLINCYAREMAVPALWDRPPVHDEPLRARWWQVGASHWLRLPLDASSSDLYAPLDHLSTTGRHTLAGPVLIRRRGDDALVEIGLLGLFDRIVAEYRQRAPLTEATADRLRARVGESRDNLADILAARSGQMPTVDRFGGAEHGLWVGHPYHPLSKSRWGWSPDQVRRYSPEHGGWFQLAYFLADPAVVIEDFVDGSAAVDTLRHELATDDDVPPPVKAALVRRPDWRLLPVHPWEEAHLLADPAVRAATGSGQLIALGTCGRPWTATSSVRTVYRPDLGFQLKFSLHVAITNNERVNQLHELHKGVAVARLLDSPLGQRMQAAMPWLHILRDPGYLTLDLDGHVVDGFSTVIRDNPYHGDERVAVVGTLCEPGLFGPSPLRRLATTVAEATGTSIETAALAWFDRYLQLVLDAAVPAHDRFGLSLEVHLQNLGVALAADGMPDGLFFRDNQGFFVRHGRAADALHASPGLADAGPCVLPEALVDDPIRYYLLVNNLLGVIQAMGSDHLCREDDLVRILDVRLRAAAASDDSGLVRDVVATRTWPAKGNLLMALEDEDELKRPVESPAPYVGVDNPILPVRHLAVPVVQPAGSAAIYRRTFDEHHAAIELRPLDLGRDLDVLFDWSNRPYAVEFWQNAGPRRELEAWYIEMLASRYHHAFLGTFDGEPTFVVETYWAPRDVVGRHYHVQPGDHGFHILVAPPTTRVPRFTRRCFQAATEMLFRQPAVSRVIAEPHYRNQRAQRVFRAVGFRDCGEIDLPDKRASLLVCSRESLLEDCADARVFAVDAGADGGLVSARQHSPSHPAPSHPAPSHPSPTATSRGDA